MRRFSPRRLTWAIVILLVAPIALGGTTMRVQATTSANQAVGQETVVTATVTRVTGQTRTHGQVTTHASPTGTITMYSLGTHCGNTATVGNGCEPTGITTGPDNNMWFALANGNQIGRFKPATHTLSFFTLPTTCGRSIHGDNYGCGPTNLVTGPDGALWFTEYNGEKIGRITTLGAITEYPLNTNGCGEDSSSEGPTDEPDCGPADITVGSDGALWFTENDGNRLGRIDPTTKAITEYPLRTDQYTVGPAGITKGPDSAVWFTEPTTGYTDYIARKAPNGVVTEYPIPSCCSIPIDIVTGSGNALYFTEALGNAIGRVTTSGLFSEFQVITSNSQPVSITKGADGNLWFTEANAGNIGRMTPAGDMTEYPIPYTGVDSRPTDVTPGPNGGTWFVARGTDQIGFVTA